VDAFDSILEDLPLKQSSSISKLLRSRYTSSRSITENEGGRDVDEEHAVDENTVNDVVVSRYQSEEPLETLLRFKHHKTLSTPNSAPFAGSSYRASTKRRVQSAPTDTSQAKRVKADYGNNFMPPPASASKRVSQSQLSMANTSFPVGTALQIPVSKVPRQNVGKVQISQIRKVSRHDADADESYDRLLPMVDKRYRTVGNVTWCIGNSYFWNPASKSYTSGGGGEKDFTDRKIALRKVILGMAKCVYLVRLGEM
jgi:hypothetical protein